MCRYADVQMCMVLSDLWQVQGLGRYLSCKFTEPRQPDAAPMPRWRQAPEPPPPVPGSQSQPAHNHHFCYIAAPHFWCRIQLLVPGEMLLQGSYVLVQVTHRLVWFLVLGGSAWCCVQAIGQSQAGSRAPVSPGGNGLLVVAPGVHFGIRPLVLLRCTGSRIYQGITATPCPPPVLRLILARRGGGR